MFAVCVTFRIFEGRMDEFRPRMGQQARESLDFEPDCHRFDICTDRDRADQIFLYELYTDAAAFALHNESAHFKSFASDVAEMVADKCVSTFTTVDIGVPT